MIRPKSTSRAFLTLLTFGLLSFGAASCGDDNNPGNPGTAAAGPFDGNWQLSSVKCDDKDVGPLGANVSFRFQNTLFQANLRDNLSGCTVTINSTASYPTSGTVVVTDQGSSCNPQGCNDVCDDPVDREPETVNYSVSGDTLTFTSTATEGGGFCSAGQRQSLVLNKQG